MSVLDRPVLIRISYTNKLSKRVIIVKSLSLRSEYRKVNLRNLDGKVSWSWCYQQEEYGAAGEGFEPSLTDPGSVVA
jgi:hypothetical protein